jgi:hypothetical protein
LDAKRELLDTIDLAFIDGMHQFEYALRDFINIEHCASPTSLVVVDDIFPNHPVQAKRVRESRVWTGSVWKLLACLRKFRGDLILIPVDTSPAGSLLIAGLDPSSRVLIEEYNPIVRHFVDEIDDVPPIEVLGRCNALQPDHELIIELLRLLRQYRDECAGQQSVRERLAMFARRLAPWKSPGN